jgi:kynurenine formamidase
MTEDFRTIGARLSNWGRFGEDDELGTLNFLTPACRTGAASLVRRGVSFDLGMPLDANGPQRGGNRFNPIHRMTSIPSDGARPDGMIVTDDVVTMPLQCATQWDGLTHVGYDGFLYNGVPASAVTAARGATRNSFHLVAPHLVGRGVLLDVAGLHGVDVLEPGAVITADELDAAAATQGVEVRPGDLLLVRTGWYRHFLVGDSETYLGAAAPGLDMSCCEWLHRQEVAAVASDNYLVEVVPTREPPPALYPFHMVMIRDVGMTLGEMFDLEELAADCRDDGVWEFLLAASGLKVTGSSGSPVTPVAVK